MRFVDTNILLYAIGAKADHPDKTQCALGLLGQSDLALSLKSCKSSMSRQRARHGGER